MDTGLRPSYLSLSKDDFETKIDKAYSILAKCILCPRDCKVNRFEGKIGICNSGVTPLISSYGPHYGEEKELVGKFGSGTIFFTNCNLKCVFCQNYDISHLGKGYEVSIEKLSDIMISLQNRKCHNINFVTPTHYMPQIIKSVYLSRTKGLNIPLVYNCGGYESITSIRLLRDIIDIYMPDFKFGSNKSGFKYLGVKDYFDKTKKAIKEMHNQVGDLKLDDNGIAKRGLLIRHLVMPNNSSKTDKVIEYISKEISRNSYVNLMDQYYPSYNSKYHLEINRRLTKKEFLDSIEISKKQLNR